MTGTQQQSIPFKELCTHLEGRGEIQRGKAINDVSIGKTLEQWPELPADLAQEVRTARSISISHLSLQSRSRSGFSEKPLLLPHVFVQGLIDHGVITLRDRKDNIRTSLFCDRHNLQHPSAPADVVQIPYTQTAEHTAA